MSREHAYIGVQLTDAGHVGFCRCGFATPALESRTDAQSAVVAHIGALVTPDEATP